MATCPTCGTTVILGGYKDEKKRYCNKKCYEADEVNRVAENIPLKQVEQLAKEIHDGPCPNCNSPGPIDIHKSYSVYSVIIYTSWQTNEHFLCKKCASKKQITDLIGSTLLGWWGIPFGFLVTPIQIIRNVISMNKNPGIDEPTDDLKQRARLILASSKLGESA